MEEQDTQKIAEETVVEILSNDKELAAEVKPEVVDAECRPAEPKGLDKLDMDKLANIHMKLLTDLKNALTELFDSYEEKGLGKKPVYEKFSQMIAIAGTYPLPRDAELANNYTKDNPKEAKVIHVLNVLDDLRLNYFILSASQVAEKEKKNEPVD